MTKTPVKDVEWRKVKIQNPLYNVRFNYYEKKDGKGVTYYKRTTKLWWKPFVKFVKEEPPYWLSRFFLAQSNDVYTLTNWEFMQYSAFGKWTKIEYQGGTLYKVLDVDKYKLETGKNPYQSKQ